MINNPERVIDFLRNNRLLSFSTISSETNSPQISLVYYVLGDSNDLFVSASSESDKIKNILKNNRVAMLVGQEVDPIVLQIEGTAEIVTDVALKMKLLLSISNAANQNVNSYNMPPLVKLIENHSLSILRVKIDKFKYSDFSQVELSIVEGSKEDLFS